MLPMLVLFITLNGASLRAESSCSPYGIPFMDEAFVELTLQIAKRLDYVSYLYKKIKKNFQNSDQCNPAKMYGQSADLINPLITNHFDDHGVIGKELSNASGVQAKLKVVEKYIPKNALEYNEINQLLIKSSTDYKESYNYLAKVKLVMIRSMNNQEKKNPNLWAKLHKKTLVENKIFSMDKNNKPVCPFPSEDAFRTAYMGYLKVKDRPDVKKKNQLTIVDYTMPFNARRMFVMNVDSGSVDYNTWTAHGGGKGDAHKNVSDEDGSNPKVGGSNSNLTREGFMIADSPFESPNHGPSLKLKGLGPHNKKLIEDQVWLHKWNAFGGVESLVNKGSKKAPKPNESAGAEFTKLARESRIPRPIVPTDGCLGVPEYLMDKFLDPQKGLPGSVILSYTGPKELSEYLNEK